MAYTYVKKITASLGWLRSLAEVSDPSTGEIMRPASPPVPLMRIRGKIVEGWQEVSEYGEFVRWIGEFHAQTLNRDASATDYISRNLILPSVASEYLAMAMTADKKETTVKGRTGEHFSTPEDFQHVEFAIELWIKAPTGEKRSATGYEFDVKLLVEPKTLMTLDAIGADLPTFGQPALTADTPTEGATENPPAEPPAPEPTDAKEPAADAAEGSGRGKRHKAA